MAARDDLPIAAGPAASMNELIEESLNRLSRWVESQQYRAYDPGDGQMSFLRTLTFGSQTLERVLTATVLRSPFNIRPLLGIKPHTSTKGMGYMAWGYLRRFQSTGDPHHAERARMCLDWLLDHRSPGYADLCWGNEFTFTTRAGRIPRGEPTIVWSGLIGQAFVDAFEILGDPRYLEAAKSTCDWILKLPREQTSDRRVPQLCRIQAGVDPQLEHAGGRIAGACRRTHRADRGDRCGPAGDAVQLRAATTGRRMVLWRGPKVPLDRQLSYGL